MFKKIMHSSATQYIVAAVSMLVVFALTLSLGSSLASYTKDLGTIATISLMTTDDRSQLILHEGFRFRNNVMHSAPFYNSTKLVFGTWNDHYDDIGVAGTQPTLESFIRTGEAQNAVDCSSFWNRGILAFYNSATKTTYVLSAQDRKIYANENSESLIYFGNQEWQNAHNGSIWNETLTEIVFDDNFDTSMVKDWTSFFGRMKNLTTINGIENFDTSAAIDMSQMFYYLPNLVSVDGWAAGTLNLTRFDTSKVTNMHGMFVALHKISTIDLSSFDNSSLQYVGSFASGALLNTIYVSEKWKLKEYPIDADGPAENPDGSTNLAYCNLFAFPADSQDMNGNAYTSQLASPGSNSYSFQKTQNPTIYQSCKYANWLYGYFTLKDTAKIHSTFMLKSGSDIRTYFMKDLRWTGTSTYNCTRIILGSWNDYGVLAGGADHSYESFLNTATDTYAAAPSWTAGYADNAEAGNIRTFANNGTLYILSAGHNTLYLNQNCTSMFALGTGTKDTNTADGIPMKGPNESVTNITLDGVNANYCTNMNELFAQCRALTKVSGFHAIGSTAKVTDMSEMFYYNFELFDIDLSTLETDAVTNMYAMFIGCESLTSINFGAANFSKLKIAGNMFNGLKLCERIYVNPATGHFPTLSTTNTSANANLEQYNTRVFFNCPLLTGNHGDMLANNTTEYSYAYAHTNDGGFFTSSLSMATLGEDLFQLPEGAVTGLDLGLAPNVISSMPSQMVIDTILETAEENTPKNYSFDSLMFYNEEMGITQQVDLANVDAFLESCYEYGDELELYITPVYMPNENSEAELPFTLQDGYISGLDIGLEPDLVTEPLDMGGIFDLLNKGEENTPEGYLLDTFMFYNDYQYKEMYIEDAEDFLDAYFSNRNADPLYVTPLYMPDPDYVPPVEEEPVEDTPAVEDTESGTSTENNTTDESGESESVNTPADTPVETPEETPAETPVETPEETPEDTAEDTPTETPDETPAETPVETPEETPTEAPVETPSADSGASTDSGSTDTGTSDAASSESGSTDTGTSDGGDSGSGDSGDSGAASLLLSGALATPFRRMFSVVSLLLAPITKI